MAEVRIEHVYKTFRSKGKEVEAVKDLNLTIRDGEFMVILGPSGCGKTTTLRMIVGLEDITRGKIYIKDRAVNDLTPQERNIAMAFETYALYNHLSVKENLLFPLKARKTPADEQETRLHKIVEMLEMEDILNMKPSQLSGGQQQRVSLGRALIRRPDVFFLDEPLSHLDINLRINARNRIKRLHAESMTTMVLVTHDQLEAMALADRIAVMNFAELQQVGTPRELLDQPVNLFVAGFVGEPAINLLTGRLICEQDEIYITDDAKIRQKTGLKKIDGSGQIVLGIRPHDLIICGEGEADLAGQVEVVEFLGEQKQITFRVGENLLTSIVSVSTKFEQGQNIYFRVRNGKLHVFDKQTERRLDYQHKGVSVCR
ncbi:MAG: ABC transporter ATP-binding protein [Firmicutes bacterium HGW-Firmicutes-14]|nr:MAG: ABC transporter ATP-binding protein [Firmicutes bacterium HGW-Firmicutes-14]